MMALSSPTSPSAAREMLTVLLAVFSLFTGLPGACTAEDSESTNDRLVKLAEATATIPELKEQMETQISEGDFEKASRTGQTIYQIRANGPDPNPAALFYIAGEIIDCMIAHKDLVAAADFSNRVLGKLRELQAPGELLEATRQTIQAIEQMRVQLASDDRDSTHRYLAVMRTTLTQRFANTEDTDADANPEQEKPPATPSPRAKMLALEKQFFDEDHFYVVQSLVSVAFEHVVAGDLDNAKSQLHAISQRNIPVLDSLLKGHVAWLKTEIALAENDLDAATEAAWQAAEGYGEPWAVDGAVVLSGIGYALQDAERYAEASDFQQAAAEAFMRCGMLHDSLNEAAWLVASQRMSERWQDASHTTEQALWLADALLADDYHGTLWLEKAWIAEAQGSLAEMERAYEKSVSAYQRLGQIDDALNVLQYMAESYAAIIDNKNAMKAYDRLVNLALLEQQHERAADAAVDAAARQRRMSDVQSQVRALEGYRDRMREAGSMRIVMDEIARIQSGMGEKFTKIRRQTREILKQTAAGEERDKRLAELAAGLENSAEGPDAEKEAEAFAKIARDHLKQQQFGLAAENFFNAAQWCNESEEGGGLIHYMLQLRGHALLRSHRYEDASVAYRIAADHVGDNFHLRWSCNYWQAMSLLAAHRTEEAAAIVESLVDPESLKQVLEPQGVIGREEQVLAEWTLTDALWKKGDFDAANKISSNMLQRLCDWLGELTAPFAEDADVPFAQLDPRWDLAGFRDLQSDYLDTRDRLSLSTFDENTMVSRYPARTIVVAVREGLFRDEMEGIRLLNRIAEQATTPETLQSVARQCAEFIGRSRYAASIAIDDPPGTNDLFRARTLRSQEKFEPTYTAAMLAIEAQEELPEDQQASLLRIEAELLACEALVRWPGGGLTGHAEEARKHLGQAEALLSATGNRADEMARCGALRYLIESDNVFDAASFVEFRTAEDWMSDYLLAVSPEAPPQPSLVAIANETFLDQILDDEYFARDEVRQALQVPGDVRDSMCVIFTPGSEKQNVSLIGSAPEIFDDGARFITRAVCLAILDRLAGGQIGPFYQWTATDDFGNDLAYSLHLDAIRALHSDREWLVRISESRVPPGYAVLWVENPDQAITGESSERSDVQSLVVRRLFDGRDSLFRIVGQPQQWQALLDWGRRNLPGEDNKELLDGIEKSFVLLPKMEGEEIQQVRFSARGMDRLRKLVTTAAELPLPETTVKENDPLELLQELLPLVQ